MIRRFLRVVVRLGLAGGAGFALFKFVQARRSTGAGMPSGDTSMLPKRSEQPLVAPKMLHGVALKKTDEERDESGDGQVVTETATAAAPAVTEAAPVAPPAAEPEATPAAAGTGAWVDPDGVSCPATHPVKAKLASGIYHLPGMLAYERTTPDRCYVDSEAAEADGLRKAKR